MRLTEVLKNPLKWEIDYEDPLDFSATFIISKYQYTFSAEKLTDELVPDTWEITFYQEDITMKYRLPRIDITGTGHQFIIFATIIDIVTYFLKKYKPHQLVYFAEEESRQSLYSKIFKNVLPNWIINPFRNKKFKITNPTYLKRR